MTCPYCSNRLPDYLRQQVVAAREEERRRREADRARVAAERAAKEHQVKTATSQVDKMNEILDSNIRRLETLLEQTLAVDDHLEFETLKDTDDLPEFDPGHLGIPTPQPRFEAPELELPPEPSFVARLVPGRTKRHAQLMAEARANHERAVKEAEAAHNVSLETHARDERKRVEDLSTARGEHEEAAKQLRIEVEEQHRRIDELRAEFEAGRSDAVCAYFDLVLQRSSYPDDFPKEARLAFVPESRQLVVEYELPPFEVIPSVASYKYVKSKNSISEAQRSLTQRKQLYSSVVAQVAIRTLHELFEADRSHLVETIVFNGMVNAIDKGTGQEIRPCLVTVRTTRDSFKSLDLARVEPLACLRS